MEDDALYVPLDSNQTCEATRIFSEFLQETNQPIELLFWFGQINYRGACLVCQLSIDYLEDSKTEFFIFNSGALGGYKLIGKDYLQLFRLILREAYTDLVEFALQGELMGFAIHV